MEDAGEPTRVQFIALKDQKEDVPPQYIQPPENRPNKHNNLKISDHKVPVIDLTNDRDVDLLREEISRACREWGAFHVINHDIPISLLNDIRSMGKTFFEDLAMAEKLSYSCDSSSPASEGYGSRMLVASEDVVLDWRDYFDHHTLPLSRRNVSRWPHFPSNYRKVIAEYSDQMKLLAQKLLGLISTSLGLSSSFIEEAIGEFYQNITISYYPACPQPELTLGLQSHSDMGFITLLIQDNVAGLEVSKDGQWVTVDTLSHAILVILGDQTEIITNGMYRSAEHRAVTNENRARLSVAAFHDPPKTTPISPAFAPPRYREVVYGDYISSWYTKGPNGKRNIDDLII